MELRQLRYFIALAEHLHFGRAASAACISQSALSQQIQKLERELGAMLFVRQVGNVALTAAGRALLPRARQTLRHSELCYAGVARRPAHEDDGDAGSLIRISYPASAAHIIARMGLADFANAWPGTSFDIIENPEGGVLSSLALGQADVALNWVPARPAPSALESVTVYSVEPRVVVSAAHRLAQRPSIEWSDLAGETQVIFERSLDPALYDTLRAPLAPWGVKACHVGPMSANFFASIGTGFSISCAELDPSLADNPAVRLLRVRCAPLRMQMAAHYGCGRIAPAVRRLTGFLHGRFVQASPRKPQPRRPGDCPGGQAPVSHRAA